MKHLAKPSMVGVRKILYLVGLMIVSSAALATIPITEGNTQQKSCIENRISLYKLGKVLSGSTVLKVKDKRIILGKPLAPGDVIYYVSLTDNNKKVYQTAKQIEVIDSSPLTPDVVIPVNKNIAIAGTFISSTGKRLDLINVGSGFNHFFMPVNDAGYVCSDRLETDNLVLQGMPQAYQDQPLKAVIEEDSLVKPKITSVAITYSGGTGATVSFEVTVMINGNVEMKKTSSFDAFSSSANIGNLSLSFKADAGQLTINSVDEPAEYMPWVAQLRNSMSAVR